jgi:hypothetical protein
MNAAITIAALFVDPKGPYAALPDVDLWDESRDARKYTGPFPVVAHPPCARWGSYATGGPSAPGKYRIGDDDGCFSSALSAVQEYGGVLEHPANSKAWQWYGITPPPFGGGWARNIYGGWSCQVDQSHYGHRARKGTWLYAFGVTYLPSLEWRRGKNVVRIDAGFHSAAERALAKAKGWVEQPRMGRVERRITPPAFRDVLLSIARSVRL